MGTLIFEPLIVPALWAALAVLAVPLLAWYGLSRPGRLPRLRWAATLALHGAGIGLVLLILLNPTWIESLPPPAGKPRLTLLVDASASMNTPDGGDGRSRFQQAARAAGEIARRLNDDFDIQTRTFAEGVSPADAQRMAGVRPSALTTDLATAIGSSSQEDHPQGQAVVLLSDGIHNAGGGSGPVLEAARRARAMAAPVYTHTLGGQADVRDLSVEIDATQELAFAGQSIGIEARLAHRGLAGGRTVVALVHDGRELARQEVTLPQTGPAVARFDVTRPRKGLYRYEVRAEPLPGEATAANNTAPIVVRVVDEPIRILLLEGKPYWDAKFLMRTLAGDPLVELDCVVKVAEGRLVRQTLSADRAASASPESAVAAADGGPAATQPARLRQWNILTDPAQVLAGPDALRSYQVIVLGRDAEAFLSETGLAHLRDWIARDGGALLCYRGSPMAQISGRLAGILPVEWTSGRETRFHVKLTERGRALRWLPGAAEADAAARLAELPTLATAAQVGRTKPLTAVLATAVFAEGGPETPVVSYQPYGTGRAVVIEGAGLWRWAFLPPQQQEHDAVYGTLWHSLLRWLATGGGLMPGQKLALRADKMRFAANEPAAATLRLREAPAGALPQVELIGPDGQARTLTAAALKDEPGTYRVLMGRLPVGRYELRAAAAAGRPATRRAAGTRPAAEGGEESTLFEVAAPIDEQLDLNARPDLMARIADESGGAVLAEASAVEIRERFREHTQAHRPPRIRRTSVWDRWWAMLLVFATWTAGWALRRSGGLI
ncbi:MAG: hypothetical protein HRF43_14840 [Phycisphaerae bacterium]|jgi:hypothetical protein